MCIYVYIVLDKTPFPLIKHTWVPLLSVSMHVYIVLNPDKALKEMRITPPKLVLLCRIIIITGENIQDLTQKQFFPFLQKCCRLVTIGWFITVYK